MNAETEQRVRKHGEDLLRQECVDRGFEIDHHESDLYIRYTKETSAFMKEYGDSRSREGLFDMTWSLFSDQDGAVWYDVPFAYEGERAKK